MLSGKPSAGVNAKPGAPAQGKPAAAFRTRTCSLRWSWLGIPLPRQAWAGVLQVQVLLVKPALDREMLLLEGVGSRNHQRELR